jgi:hypothetical protein
MVQGRGFPSRGVGGRQGVVSHVGARLLADIAAATGLIEFFDEEAAGRRG